MFKLLFYSSLLFFYACTNRTDKVKPQPNVHLQWQYLILEFKDTVVTVAQAEPTSSTLEVSEFKKGVRKYPISPSERDSLFAWSNQLIDFHGHPKWFCTDYAGKLKVHIQFNSQLYKEVRFSSICNWREINATTDRIDQLLKNVVGAK